MDDGELGGHDDPLNSFGLRYTLLGAVAVENSDNARLLGSSSSAVGDWLQSRTKIFPPASHLFFFWGGL
jgi:hypothetical protein